MEYHEHILSKPLTDYIQTMWAMQSENDTDHYPKSQIMPDGIVEVIFHYGNSFYTYQDGKRFLQPDSFAISMMRKYVEIESNGIAGFVSVRFFPWGAYHFFDKPVKDFLDQTLDARELWGNQITDLREELKSQPSIEEKFSVVEKFLLEQYGKFKRDDRAIDNVIKWIREQKGMMSVEEIGSRAGLSKKQLERKFLSTVGTTPKTFARITRFLNLCQNLEDHKGRTLTELTHDCGYYDQAHFIKEFKEFSGYTPKEFYERENVYFTDI